MARHYNLEQTELKKLATLMEDWQNELGGIDERGHFAISTANPNVQWDWYEIGGRYQDHLPGNIQLAETLLNRSDLKSLLPAALVTPDGTWHERETFITTSWTEGRFVAKLDRDWLKEVREALSHYPMYRVVCVDLHN